MLRGLMVVLTLAATAAQAQEPAKAAEGTQGAVLPQAEQRGTTLAARSAPDARLGAPSVPGEGTSDKLADCSLVQIVRKGRLPVVRTYPPPRPVSASSSEKAPYVQAVVRCDQLYIFQIWTGSKDSWAAGHARLEVPNGETLDVNGFYFDNSQWGFGIITIVATAPPGMKIPKLKLTLTSKDGRAAVLEARDLP